MFTNNRKRRASTLSKTLLAAGLLGGAALTSLGAGSAQAAWDPETPFGFRCVVGGVGGAACDFNGSDTTPAVPSPNGDKKLTLLSNPVGLLDGDSVTFTKQATAWEVDLDFLLDRSATFNPSGSLDYKVEITDPNFSFSQSQLSSLLSQVPAVPVGPFTVTKQVYSNSSFSGTPILTLINNELPPVAGTLVASGPIGGSTIYVRDTWSIATGSNTILDAIQNNYTQTRPTQTPGPLPLLGAGAAFGFSRRLRSRVMGARLA